MKIHFHIDSFAQSLALKQRLGSTQKWPMGISLLTYVTAISCVRWVTLAFIVVYQIKAKGVGHAGLRCTIINVHITGASRKTCFT